MGIFKQSISFSLPKNLEKLGYLRGVLVGVIFAFVYTPCVGAVLGAILSLAAVSQTVYKGAVYLFVYSLGIAAVYHHVAFFYPSLAVFEEVAAFDSQTFLGSRSSFSLYRSDAGY